MRSLLRGSVVACVFGLFVLSGAAQAQTPATFYYQTYLDVDGNTGTGCTVTVLDNGGTPQTLNGVDTSLILTITSGALVSSERFACSGGAMVSQGADPTHPTYTLGGAFIEYRLPNVTLTPASTIGFAASTDPNFVVPSDVMFASGGNPILLAPLLLSSPGVPIPVSTPLLLLFIAIAAGLIAARSLRVSRYLKSARMFGVLALFVCLAGLSGAVLSALQIALDGNDGDWTGISVLAVDPEGDAPYPEIDLTRAYGLYQGGSLYLKLDLKQKPANTVTPPPAPSDFRLLGATVTEPDSSSQVAVSGTAARIRGTASQVRIENTRTGETLTAFLVAGAWQGQLIAKARDVLELTPVAGNGSTGGAIRLTVQGTPAEPSLPPDPINGGIAPQLDPLLPYTLYDSTRFLYTRNLPVQIGVDPDAIKPKTAALLVGKVLDRGNAPLSGVTVIVKDHDQYGHTLTRTDGQWDLVVNGGQWFTVEYRKDGFLPIQRKVQVAWQDYGYLPDVVLIPLDRQVGIVDLRETGADAPAFQIHQGSVSTDADGPRQATVLFPKGVKATMELPDGTTQALDILNVRATEYTVGQNGPNAMPGELPPATGYTYAVELSVDQAVAANAKQVIFDQSLPMYVDNFLDFSVGEIAPLGWYSHDKKAWVPDENGYVIKILSINNGSAVLDVKGQGDAATAQELVALGISAEELKAIAQLYPAGKTLWRVRVSHFTPYDVNWPAGAPACQLGESCEPPFDPDENSDPEPDPDEDDACPGCIIRVGNRSIGETVSASGTPFSLHYESGRREIQPKTTTMRSLRGAAPLQSAIVRVTANVKILGRNIQTVSSPSGNVGENDTSEYRWNGEDRYGRRVLGKWEAQHEVSYSVQAYYYPSRADAYRSFGQYSGDAQGYVQREGDIFTVSNTARHFLTPPENSQSILMRTADLGRWTLSVHHHYDPVSKILAMGDGMDRTAQSIAPQLVKMRGYSIGYNFRTEPIDVEPLPDGSVLYLMEYFDAYSTPQRRRAVERVSGDGENTEIIWEAAQGDVPWPSLIHHDRFNGGLYIVDSNQHTIYYRHADGRLVKLAGKNTQSPHSGNNVYDPQQLVFGSIGDITVGHDGSLYIVDGLAQCVRKLDPAGHMATIAGNCGLKQGREIQDGTSATSGDAWTPYSIAMDTSGQLIVGAEKFDRANGYFCSLQKIDTGGRIFTAAGAKNSCLQQKESDEVDPGVTTFAHPRAIAIGYRNDIYFSTNSFIRRLADNKLKLLLGDSEALGSGMPPSREPVAGQFDALNILIKPTPMKVDAGGNIYFKSAAGHIFMLREGLPGFDGEEFLIPSSDGREVYRFNAHGRHLETLDALTGAAVYRFGYDGAGLLQTITDHDGNETRIERSGGQATIIGPYGHCTELGISNGNAVSIKNPAGETWQFAYNADGLMSSATTPRGRTSNYEWDAKKKLLADHWPNGGGWTVASSLTDENHGKSTYKVSMTSGEGRVRHFESRNETFNWWGKPPITRPLESSVTAPDGLITRTKSIGTTMTSTLYPDGTQTDRTESGDPRFGVLAPYNVELIRVGKKDAADRREIDLWSTSRQVETANGALLPVKSWKESVWRWGELFQSSEYIHADRRWRIVSPSGKETSISVDTIHRPLGVQRAGEPTMAFSYDARGRVESVRQTAVDGASTRQWKYSYDTQGSLAQMLEPLNRATSFGYDAVGRVTRQTLPGSREIAMKYDPQGNLEELRTPAGDIHRYAYDAMGDTSAYTPPTIGGQMVTAYRYDKDRRLTGIVLPDASAIDIVYGQASGRLQKVVSPEPDKVPAFDAGGRLTGWTQGSNALVFGYGSLYPESVAWSGDVNGTVISHRDPEYQIQGAAHHRMYQNKGWLDGLSVVDGLNRARRLNFEYDADGLLAEVVLKPGDYVSSRQSVRLERDDKSGRLKHLYGWNGKDRDVRAYDTFGAVQSYRFNKLTNDLQSFHTDLADHAQPVDALIVKGRVSRAGQYAYFQDFWLSPSAAPSENARLPLADDGTVDITLALPGTAHAAQPYRLSNTEAGDDWWRDIGSLARIERQAAAMTRLLDARDGIVYHEVEQDWGDKYRIARYRPASGATNLVEVEGQDALFGADADLIGVDGDGRMYFQHRMGSWQCGQTPADGWNACVTVQSDATPARELLAVPHGWDEDLTLRYVDGGSGAPSFYAVRYQSGGYDCNDFIVERWDQGAARQVARIRNERYSGYQCRFHGRDGVAQATVAGQDLLLLIGYGHEFPNTSALLRIKPSGQVTEIPLSEEDRIRTFGAFAEGDHTCTLRQKHHGTHENSLYRCWDAAGRPVKEALLPAPYPTRWGFEPPALDAATDTLYYLNHNLWSREKPATKDLPWKDAADGRAFQMATLTLVDDTSYIEEGYGIEVERDELGRVTRKAETLNGAAIRQNYLYDAAGRLIEITGDNAETWGYDANGNRTHRNGQQIATFDAQDRILTQGSTAYTHNLLGQRAEKNRLGQITRYDYDVFGGLKRVALPDGTAVTYVQDPAGRRIGRKENGAWTHKWLYQDALNPIAELDGNDKLKKLFVYADKGHVPAYMITYDEDGTEDKRYRIVSDLLGSVRLVYDLDSGEEAQRIDYDVWGNITNDTNPGFQPFGFAGGLYDHQTKLTRFGARDYDPETGRWTAKDPIGFNAGDTNLYGYVFNDPVNFIDPTGKFVWWVIPIIVTGGVIVDQAYGVYMQWWVEAKAKEALDDATNAYSSSDSAEMTAHKMQAEQRMRKVAFCALNDALQGTAEFALDRLTDSATGNASKLLPKSAQNALEAYQTTQDARDLLGKNNR